MPVPDPGPFAENKWVGSSKNSKLGIHLEAAIDDAYNQATSGQNYENSSDDESSSDRGGPYQFRVEDIYVIGTNPITEYRVLLGLA